MSTDLEKATIKKEQPRLEAYFWGGVLVWVGVIWGVSTIGELPQIGHANEWSWIFLGAGIWSLLLNFISLTSSKYATPKTWDWIWGAVFLLIGLAGFATFSIPWWLVLIVIGVAMLIGAFRNRD